MKSKVTLKWTTKITSTIWSFHRTRTTTQRRRTDLTASSTSGMFCTFTTLFMTRRTTIGQSTVLTKWSTSTMLRSNQSRTQKSRIISWTRKIKLSCRNSFRTSKSRDRFKTLHRCNHSWSQSITTSRARLQISTRVSLARQVSRILRLGSRDKRTSKTKETSPTTKSQRETN